MKGREGGREGEWKEDVKNEVFRQFLGLKVGRQGEEGGSRNPKLEETSFKDVLLVRFLLVKLVQAKDPL